MDRKAVSDCILTTHSPNAWTRLAARWLVITTWVLNPIGGTAQEKKAQSKQSFSSQDTNDRDSCASVHHDYLLIDRTGFHPPSENETQEIETFLLELELSSRLTEQIGFSCDGSYFYASQEPQQVATSLRRFSMGWAVDNKTDRERLLFISQEQIQPKNSTAVISLDQSLATRLDRLRVGTNLHESEGPYALPPNEHSHLEGQFRINGVFYPIRASIAHPLDCWSGRAMNRNKQLIDCNNLIGIQERSNGIVALFCIKPASFYEFYISTYFKEGLPVQADFWRFSLLPASKNPNDPQDPLRSFPQAKHVATTTTQWSLVSQTHLPVSIRSHTIQESHLIELAASFRWVTNDSVNQNSFELKTLGDFYPNEIDLFPLQKRTNQRQSFIQSLRLPPEAPINPTRNSNQ